MPENGNGKGRGSSSRGTPTQQKGLKGKIGGIPVWIIVAGALVLAYVIYQRSQVNQASSSPTDMSGTSNDGTGYGQTLTVSPSTIRIKLIRPAPIHHRRRHGHTVPSPAVQPRPPVVTAPSTRPASPRSRPRTL